ncbi:hypothetical protein VTN00DRAFT_692 [Thermoascus crustaceus]|uniref:uncharacterized protein n=1 Tax=Thermoascus crustaceus TaxID=5088 RepID=UPI003742BA34
MNSKCPVGKRESVVPHWHSTSDRLSAVTKLREAAICRNLVYSNTTATATPVKQPNKQRIQKKCTATKENILVSNIAPGHRPSQCIRSSIIHAMPVKKFESATEQ